MAKKLNFLFTSRLWRSTLLKVLLFELGLFGVYFFSFSSVAVSVFAVLLLGIYFSQLPERGRLRISFFVLALTALLTLNFLAGSFYLVIFGCLVFGFLFYLLLGLKTLIFQNRQSVYLFFNTCLFLAVFMLFFGVDKSKYFLVINALLFFAVFIIFKECFDFLRSVNQNSLFIIHNSSFIALVFAFLALELFWAINLLPIGFINSAILLTLFVFLMRDISMAYFSGLLDKRFLISHFLVFVILSVFVFVFSKWGLT